jgi:hypothetical protein
VTGKVLSMIPLRNRRLRVITRTFERMTEWRWGRRLGYGLSEYPDRLSEMSQLFPLSDPKLQVM